MFNDLGHLLECSRFHCESINSRCNYACRELRKVAEQDCTALHSVDVSEQVDIVCNPNINEVAEAVVLADKAINKAQTNLKVKPTSSSIARHNVKAKFVDRNIKDKEKTPVHSAKVLSSHSNRVALKEKRPAMPVSRIKSSHSSAVSAKERQPAKPASVALPSHTCEVAKVQKELESLLIKEDQKKLPKEKPKPRRVDPCLTGQSNSGEKQRNYLARMASLYEDCWMLQRHALSEKDIGLKYKSQFCSKLQQSASEHNGDEAKLLSESLRLSDLLGLTSRFSSQSQDEKDDVLLSAADILWYLCIMRRLMDLHSRLGAFPALARKNCSENYNWRVDTIPFQGDSLWVPNYLFSNSLNVPMLTELAVADRVPLARSTFSRYQCLLAQRYLLSRWSHSLVKARDVDQWTTGCFRGLENLLCGSRLALPFVILES